MTERCLVVSVRSRYARDVISQDGPSRHAHTAALEELRHRYELVRTAIEAIPEATRAYDAASHLRDVIDDLVGDAARLRARMAYRIAETEQLSLAALANRINVSKTRADQLIRLARSSEP